MNYGIKSKKSYTIVFDEMHIFFLKKSFDLALRQRMISRLFTIILIYIYVFNGAAASTNEYFTMPFLLM